MLFSFKRRLLKVDHFIVSAILFAFIIAAFTSFHLWQAYKTQQEVHMQHTVLQAEKIASEMDNTLSYITKVLQFLGEKIVPTKGTNYEYISQIFNDQFITNKRVENFFSWTGFDWTTPEGMLVASTIHGVMDKPIDMNFRNYVQQAPIAPGVLHFDPPSLGKTSHQWVIPAGVGIQDTQGKYLGLVSIGINISEFGKKLEKVLLNEGLRFIVIDQNMNAVYASGTPFSNLPLLESRIKSSIVSFPMNEGSLASTISYNNSEFSYYKKLANHPFIILLGYDGVIAKNEFYETVRAGGPQIVLLGILALLLIFTLRHMIVQPVKKLSETADNIVNREHIRKLPRSATYEINNLAKKLLKLRRFIRRQDIIQAKLKEANHIIKESDREKESFMRDVYQLMKEPVRVLKQSIMIMEEGKFGPINEKYKLYFAAMQDACHQLESFTTEFLYPSKVNISQIIEQCVAIHRRYATEQGVTITTDVAENIPEIWADKLRLKQIILGLIYNSLLYIPENANKSIHITVNATLHDDESPAILSLKLQDDGFGLDELEREEYWDEFFGDENGYSKNADITKQSLDLIRHLIKLHHGRFKLTTAQGEGSLFTIQLPYMDKEDIETHPDLVRTRKKQEETEKMHVDFHQNIQKNFGNIITFPKKKS